MTRYLLLGVAMFSLTTLAHANSGTVRFSGRIVDPGCNASLALTKQQLQLENCPLAAQGAEIRVASLHDNAGTPSSDTLAVHALTSPAMQMGARVFSQHYRVQALPHSVAPSSYMVVITYP